MFHKESMEMPLTTKNLVRVTTRRAPLAKTADITYKYEKHFQKMYRDVGMAVPKATETRCRDGSVQGRHVIQRLHN